MSLRLRPYGSAVPARTVHGSCSSIRQARKSMVRTQGIALTSTTQPPGTRRVSGDTNQHTIPTPPGPSGWTI